MLRLFNLEDKIVISMAAVRFLSSGIEFTAAFLMLFFGRVETAFKINSVLAAVGPTILFIVTALGLVGLAGKISFPGMAMILAGVGLIFLGISRM